MRLHVFFARLVATTRDVELLVALFELRFVVGLQGLAFGLERSAIGLHGLALGRRRVCEG